jgi:hypothetical protein
MFATSPSTLSDSTQLIVDSTPASDAISAALPRTMAGPADVSIYILMVGLAPYGSAAYAGAVILHQGLQERVHGAVSSTRIRLYSRKA